MPVETQTTLMVHSSSNWYSSNPPCCSGQLAKLREDLGDPDAISHSAKTVFNQERESNPSIKKLQKMLSTSSLRLDPTTEEPKSEPEPKQDLKDISEEKDETVSDEKKLIDFSPDQAKPETWPDQKPDPDRASRDREMDPKGEKSGTEREEISSPEDRKDIKSEKVIFFQLAPNSAFASQMARIIFFYQFFLIPMLRLVLSPRQQSCT